MKNGLTDEDRRKLDADPEVGEKLTAYSSIWNASAQLKTHKGLPLDIRLQRLHSLLEQRSGRTSFFPSVWKYAAIITVVFLTGTIVYLQLFKKDIQHIETHYGEIKTVELPDHSIVTLNGGSSIEYDASSWDDHRKVNLSGEAYFNVKPTGTSFIVVDDKASVKVLGTTFNIRSLDRVTRVACLSGKVEVKKLRSNDERLILVPGSGTRVADNERLVRDPIDPEESTAWRNRKLHFNDTPLEEVFIEVERYFGIKIILSPTLRPVKFTGRFDNPKWQDVMNTTCTSAGIHYEMKDDSIAVVRD